MEDVGVVKQNGKEYFKISKPFQWILIDGKNESKARLEVGSLHVVGKGITIKETDDEKEYNLFKPFFSAEQKIKMEEARINLKLEEINKEMEESLWGADTSYRHLKEEDSMNTFMNDLVVLITKILKADIWHGVESYKDNRSGFAYHYVNPDKNLKNELKQLLLSCNKVKKLFNCGALMNLGNSGFTLTIDKLTAWLLVRSEKDGIKPIVNKFINYLKVNFNKVKKVTLISGLEIDSSIKLNSNLDLVPVSELGLSRVKEMIAPDFLSPNNIRALENSSMRERLIPLEPNNFYEKYYPMVAVVENVNLEPQVIASLDKNYNYTFAEMAVDLLVLKDDYAPFALASWSELDEEIPCKDTGGNSWSGYANDIFPGNTYMLTLQDWDDIKPLHESLCAMNGTNQARLRLVLRRIANYKKRKLLVDKAIELGIAIEIIFLEDEERLELTRTLSQRIAKFMESDLDKKIEINKFIKRIYKLRSSAVHTGKINQNKKIKICSQEMNVLDMLNKGCDLLISSIKKIIIGGKIPLWSEFDLT